jgi:AraC-like DNA-binding protein
LTRIRNFRHKINPLQTRRPECFFQYFAKSPRDETLSTLIDLIGIGKSVIKPGEKYPSEGHPVMYRLEWDQGRTLPEFQIILLTEGAGEFESHCTGQIPLKSPALIFLFPGAWHRYRPQPETGWTERWLSFSGELAFQLLDFQHSLVDATVTTPRDVSSSATDFDDLVHLVQGLCDQDANLISLKALRIISDAAVSRLGKVIESKSTRNHLVEDVPVRHALEIIWSRSHSPISAADVARQIPLPRKALESRFADVVGHSILEEINNCRLTRAQRLLQRTELPVNMVAHLAGFTNAERMRAEFSKKLYLSPQTYRRHRT